MSNHALSLSLRVAEVLLCFNVTSTLTTLEQLTLQANNNANAQTCDLPLFNFRNLLISHVKAVYAIYWFKRPFKIVAEYVFSLLKSLL